MSDQIRPIRLGDIACFEMGQSPPSRYVNQEGKGVPFLQGSAEFGPLTPNSSSYCSVPNKLCEPGDVLVSVRAPVGDLNRADQVYCIGRGLAAIRFIDVRSDFGWHMLNQWARDLEKVAQGSTFKAISKADLDKLQVLLLPDEEQRLIAAILDTVDAAIQQTNALIAKLRQMKAGLLHDLLTHGLDEHGELRDSVAYPEQFQGSALGLIPVGWEEISLGDVVARANGVIQTGPFGSQLHAHEYTTEGIPVIMPQDIEDGFISEAQIARISESKANSLARHLVQLNDVVFARRGDLSRCAAIGQREIGWFCGTGCLLVRADQNEIFGPWLAAVYQHDQSQRQILARAVGSTMVNLNTGLLSSLLLAKPTYDEQIEIMNVIDAHDARIHAEEATREKLTLLKRGLMDDLLTGRVRVNRLEEKA